VANDAEPATLWRLRRGSSHAHATIFAGPEQTTVAWFVDGRMDRVENYETIDLAIARADEVRGVLTRDGWVEQE